MNNAGRPPGTLDAFPASHFRREDEADDRWFYAQPRLLVHLDEPALGAVSAYLGNALPAGGAVLDLMSSWRSHVPAGLSLGKLVGLGMNAAEMRENRQLTVALVHDLNAGPALPLATGVFDAAIVTVSVQYLTRPVEVFGEVRRVLRPGALFHVIYSNRMFFTKAVSIWRDLDDGGRGRLVASYFAHSGGWDRPETLDLRPGRAAASDPVFVVRSRKAVAATRVE